MPVTLIAVFLQSPWLLIALGLFAVLRSSIELARLCGRRFPPLAGVFLFALAAAGLAFGHLAYRGFPWLLLAWTLLGMCGAMIARRTRMHAWLEVGSLWIAAPIAALVYLHVARLPDDPLWKSAPLPLILLIPLWAGDTAAILIGIPFGKHKIAPAISPNKSWEGAIANLVTAVIAAALLGPAIGISLEYAALAGAAIGIVGQAGDLYQSRMKRRSGLKDSGRILPGHGGLLDRLDSLLAAAPIIAVLAATLDWL